MVKADATAPFVRKAVPGLTDKLESSGTEQYQIKSLLKNTAKCKVPKKITRSSAFRKFSMILFSSQKKNVFPT